MHTSDAHICLCNSLAKTFIRVIIKNNNPLKLFDFEIMIKLENFYFSLHDNLIG